MTNSHSEDSPAIGIPDANRKGNYKECGIACYDDLIEFIRIICGVLPARGMLGTCIYVCAPELREYIEC